MDYWNDCRKLLPDNGTIVYAVDEGGRAIDVYKAYCNYGLWRRVNDNAPANPAKWYSVKTEVK